MYIKNKKNFRKFIKFPDLEISQISTPNFLTPELTSLTPQVETAKKWSICKISFKNIEKNLNFNSRIWKIYNQGTHITKYLGFRRPSR
jgi:hypothetical protein